MKRKVKFQEGGEVSSGMTAAERRRAALERANARRSVAEFNRREQAGQLDERTMRRAGGTPVTSEIADFNRRMQSGQLDADTMRRMGGTPRSADALRSGAGMTPSAGGSALSRMAPRAGMAAGLFGLGDLAWRAYNALPERARSQEDLDIAEAYRTGRDVREIQAQRAAREGRAVFPGETPETTPMPASEATSVPAPQPTSARTQPTRRPAAPARRESTGADDLNAMVLRLQSGVAPQTETERRLADRMGIAYRKGGLVKPKVGADFRKAKPYQEGGPVKAPGKYPRMGGAKAPAPRMRDMISPEERKELDAPLTQAEKNRLRGDNFKKGGKVAPKKMMKGGITSKPKAKPAKYAKGGMTKGRK